MAAGAGGCGRGRRGAGMVAAVQHGGGTRGRGGGAVERQGTVVRGRGEGDGGGAMERRGAVARGRGAAGRGPRWPGGAWRRMPGAAGATTAAGAWRSE
jgi:hypothetical protein